MEHLGGDEVMKVSLWMNVTLCMGIHVLWKRHQQLPCLFYQHHAKRRLCMSQKMDLSRHGICLDLNFPVPSHPVHNALLQQPGQGKSTQYKSCKMPGMQYPERISFLLLYTYNQWSDLRRQSHDSVIITRSAETRLANIQCPITTPPLSKIGLKRNSLGLVKDISEWFLKAEAGPGDLLRLHLFAILLESPVLCNKERKGKVKRFEWEIKSYIFTYNMILCIESI